MSVEETDNEGFALILRGFAQMAALPRPTVAPGDVRWR